MVSEDSDQLRPGLTTVHRLDDLHDLQQTRVGKMATAGDELDACGELVEVLSLRSSQRMLPEERNHRLEQILAPSHHVSVQILPVIVVATIGSDMPDSKEFREIMEGLDATSTLCDHELVEHLVSGGIDVSRPPSLPEERDGEATFSVDEPDHPTSELGRPFLLIVRTRHVVTSVNVPPDVAW